ncbi:flagellar motor switch protein FliM [Cellulomonas endophytica]|uniref:flagellar motor switch protein FliM n=1 Tax=Cellulomonas endophytica TaxID=2494735 RepID=UPI001F0B84DB|nr:flagellar motor switch protein FliM [Cellulomonas endophytica]
MTVQSTTRPASASRRARTGVPEPYDFRRPMTMAREHARLLEMALERFARQWGTQFTARLRQTCQVTLEDLSLRVYDEYANSLPSHTGVVLCTVEQTRQTSLLQIPMDATMVWVDYLLGGAGMGDDRPARELTEIELVLVKDVLQHCLDDLGYAFAAVTPLDMSIRGVQYNPQFVQAVGAAENVLVATFSIRLGERTDTATFMIPAEPLLGIIRASSEEDTRTDDELAAADAAVLQLQQMIQDAPLEVSVRFSPVPVQPREVVGLAVGDVLPIRHPVSRPLDVVVDGVVLARAAAGSQGARLACQIVTVEENH